MGGTYNPFYGFKRLPEKDSYENLFPFSLDEQHKIIQNLPDHWKPYFDTAFKIGLRQGEQIALRSDDIDWEKDLLQVKRAITRDENGKIMIGRTKNRYSRRTIRLLPVMRSALEEQKKVYDTIQGNFFFSSPTGAMVDTSHLRKRVWKPALKKAGLDYREMKQTRHSFATNALSCGENPLWIARVLGHRNTGIIINFLKQDAKSRSSGAGSFDNLKTSSNPPKTDFAEAPSSSGGNGIIFQPDGTPIVPSFPGPDRIHSVPIF